MGPHDAFEGLCRKTVASRAGKASILMDHDYTTAAKWVPLNVALSTTAAITAAFLEHFFAYRSAIALPGQ